MPSEFLLTLHPSTTFRQEVLTILEQSQRRRRLRRFATNIASTGKQSCIRRCVKKERRRKRRGGKEKREKERKRRKEKEEQDEEQPPTPDKFENGVHRVTFPLFGREESDVWLRADARIWCPSSRRIERKEGLKKLVLSFPS